jgi:hypothetical protein
MANRQTAEQPELITYLVQRAGQPDFQLQIPADWKLTFGAVNPGAEGPSRRDLHCMRVWEGEKLRAVFCDVRGFRDLSLPFARKIEVETGTATWARDDSGNYEESSKRQLEERFEQDDRSPF